MRHLLRQPGLNADLTAASRGIATENLWRAQRYGIHGGLIDADSRSMRSVPSLVDDLVLQLAEDSAALGCEADLAACRRIASDGTSADVQLAVYEEARTRDGGQPGGLAAVVDWIASETRLDDTGWGRGEMSRRGAA